MKREKFRDFIYAFPIKGDPQAKEYVLELTKLWQLIWRRDDLTQAFEYQDELNEKWAGIYTAIREI